MKTVKVLRIKTKAAAHIVLRNGAGKKLFDIDLPGVSITITVPLDAEIQQGEPDSATRRQS